MSDKLIDIKDNQQGRAFCSFTEENSLQRLNAETVASKEEAYILGYTLADGCAIYLPQYGQYGMAWSSIDLDLLEYINSIHGNKGSITKQKKYKPEHSQCYVLNITGKDVLMKYMALGIVPRKTYNPVFPIVHDSVAEYFFLGYFDGDGCVRKQDRTGTVPVLTVSFKAYSKPLLQDILERYKKLYGCIGSVHQYQDSENPTPALMYSTRPSLIFYEKMYKAPPFFLKRKKDVFDSYIEERGGWENLAKLCRNCGNRFIKYRHNQLRCEKCYSMLQSNLHGDL